MEHLSKPKNPCQKECPFRDTYCKLDCDDYKEYEEKYKQYDSAKNKKRQADEPIAYYRKDILNKQRKRSRRHG